jgi:hypothetical protein
MSLQVLTPREASMFACLTDTIVAPEPLLPPVRATDAVAAFDSWLAHAPALNRTGLRALVVACELAPLALGFRARLRALPQRARVEALERAERRRGASARAVLKLAKSLACLCYYGDDGVMRRLGYDADAVVARGRALRIAEGRP